MNRNRTRERIASGGVALGCFLRYPDAGLAEFLGLRGFDFVVFDGEHGPLAPLSAEQMARALELHGATPIVRVEENNAASILRYLDAGALGCHVPGVDSVEDARQAVRAARFRPEGDRGLAGSRAARYGIDIEYERYIAEANREIQVIVHIESEAGVKAADDIADVDGVDVLLFGSLDLSHDLGIAGQTEHPDIVEAADHVAAAAARSGKALGAVIGGPSAAGPWLERGAQYLIATVESVLRPGIDGILGIGRQEKMGA